MKKLIAIILALATVLSMAALVSCGDAKTEDETEAVTTEAPKKDVSAEEVVTAVTNVLSFEGLVSDIITKEEDTDELIKWRYGMYEQVEMLEEITDYAISLPTDYNQTLAVFKFAETPDEETITALKETIRSEYIEARASSLQMYMPEEYQKVMWALDNEDLIWKQFDNLIVLCIFEDAEPVDAWEAIETLLSEDTVK